MQITFLGSGAATPTAERNTSGIYVKHESTALLLDCGEGSLRQILSLGLSPDVDAVCLTHDHTDHIIGLTGLIRHFTLTGRNRPVHIYGPAAALAKINLLVSLEHQPDKFALTTHAISSTEPFEFRSITVRPFETTHRVPSLGYRLEGAPNRPKINQEVARALGIQPGPQMGQLQRGESVVLSSGRVVEPSEVLLPPVPGPSLVYTGDTLPSCISAHAARHTDLLIHDSTYLAKDGALATAHAHSTAQEAAKIAKTADAKSLILTHISSRYSPEECAEFVQEAAAIFTGPVFLAQDGLTLNVGPSLVPEIRPAKTVR